MTETHWIRVAPCEDVPLREGRVVQLGAIAVALFNLGDRFLAVEGRCPHQGGPLADGIVTGSTVVCPLHAWKVNLADGCVERPAGSGRCVQTYPVRVEDGIVSIGIRPDGAREVTTSEATQASAEHAA
jgi:nitrite reductase (NADH) small subunit